MMFCGHNFKQYNYNNIIYVGENTKNNRGIIGDAWWNNRGYLVESEHSIMDNTGSILDNTGSILCLCLPPTSMNFGESP